MKGLAGVLVLLALGAAQGRAQEPVYYSRLNTFSVYVEGSDTSSHLAWGVSRRRKLETAGLAYARRFNAPHRFDWTRRASVFYEIELSPVNFLADPVATDVYGPAAGSITVVAPTESVCVVGPYLSYGGVPFTRKSCTTRWTYVGGAAPVGFRVNLRPERRVQPFVDSHLGFLVARQNEPVDGTSSFNFTFAFGAGVEMFRRRGESVAVEYRVHHFSNAYLSSSNPGVDSQLLKVTYSFGSGLAR